MTKYIDGYGNELSPEEVHHIVTEVLSAVIKKLEKHIADGDGDFVEIDNVGYHIPDNIRFFKRAKRFISDMYGLVGDWIMPDDWAIPDESR